MELADIPALHDKVQCISFKWSVTKDKHVFVLLFHGFEISRKFPMFCLISYLYVIAAVVPLKEALTNKQNSRKQHHIQNIKQR